MVKNIPTGLVTDYKQELKTIFTEFATPEST